MGQTCGWPYRKLLFEKLHLVATLDYGLSSRTVIITTASLLLAKKGFGGTMAARFQILVVNGLDRLYPAVVRSVLHVSFFMFFVIALDQVLKWIRHRTLCPNRSNAIWQGNDFIVCQRRKCPSTLRRNGYITATALLWPYCHFQLCLVPFQSMFFSGPCALCPIHRSKPPKPMGWHGAKPFGELLCHKCGFTHYSD